MPDMSPAEFEALKADIAERGVVVPIDVDESGEILDGHHRYRAWAELHKNEPPPTIVRDGLSEAEKRAFARKNNILRRHLTREQVRAGSCIISTSGSTKRSISRTAATACSQRTKRRRPRCRVAQPRRSNQTGIDGAG